MSVRTAALTQSEILEDERLLAHKNSSEDGYDYAQECYHSVIVAHPEKLNDFKPDGVFADQGRFFIFPVYFSKSNRKSNKISA